jgi:hypothetical protein
MSTMSHWDTFVVRTNDDLFRGVCRGWAWIAAGKGISKGFETTLSCDFN